MFTAHRATVGLAPLDLPPVGRLTAWHRLRLVVEVLIAYVPLMLLVRGNDLKAMVSGARDTDDVACTRVVPAAEHETAVRIGKFVQQVLSRLPTDNRCLVRSLVVVRLLARRSIDAQVIIGVHSGTSFGAHAWVEHEAKPVLPPGGFTRLVEL